MGRRDTHTPMHVFTLTGTSIVHKTPYGQHWHQVLSWLPTDLAYKVYGRQMRHCPENQITSEEYYAREPHEVVYAFLHRLDWDKSADREVAVKAVEKGWVAPTDQDIEDANDYLSGGPAPSRWTHRA